jgi:hypothetical protein
MNEKRFSAFVASILANPDFSEYLPEVIHKGSKKNSECDAPNALERDGDALIHFSAFKEFDFYFSLSFCERLLNNGDESPVYGRLKSVFPTLSKGVFVGENVIIETLRTELKKAKAVDEMGLALRSAIPDKLPNLPYRSLSFPVFFEQIFSTETDDKTTAQETNLRVELACEGTFKVSVDNLPFYSAIQLSDVYNTLKAKTVNDELENRAAAALKPYSFSMDKSRHYGDTMSFVANVLPENIEPILKLVVRLGLFNKAKYADVSHEELAIAHFSGWISKQIGIPEERNPYIHCNNLLTCEWDNAWNYSHK